MASMSSYPDFVSADHVRGLDICSRTDDWFPLQWRHNGRNNVSNHQPHDCLLNRLFRRRSKKTSKLRVTDLCVGNSPVTGEFPAQMASYAENPSIWWHHHVGSWMTCLAVYRKVWHGNIIKKHRFFLHFTYALHATLIAEEEGIIS